MTPALMNLLGWVLAAVGWTALIVVILRHKRDERFDDDEDGGSSL